MGAYDYGQIVQLTNAEIRNTYAGATSGASLLSGERYPVGTLGTTQDGRWFRFAQNGGVTLVPGNLLCGVAPVTNHVGNTATATAAGATTVTFTQGNTAVTQNQYKDGYLVISVTPGAGYSYPISSHDAVPSATAYAWPLNADSVQVALTTTSRIDLVANPYRGVIQAPATVLISNPVGVAVSAPTANQYCWIQVEGVCGVLTAGTLVAGNRAVNAYATAGAVAPETAVAATSATENTIGQVVRVAASTAWSTIDLHLLS